MLKKWDKIICYDQNPVYEKYLKMYFDNIYFYRTPTYKFAMQDQFELIKEEVIFILDNTLLKKFDKLKENKNIKHFIFYGELLW